MMGMRIFAAAVVVFRNYSTGSYGYARKWAQGASLEKTAGRKSPAKRVSRPRIEWTEEQMSVITAVSEGKSVFITGSAGTGKTALLKHVIKLLKKTRLPSKVYITASTGIAACAIRGQTLHSFAGIGAAENDRNALIERVLSDRRATWRWKRAQVLVIDEISMIDGVLFDHLESIAREVRDSKEPWGGIQLVVCGDFSQLPPVTKSGYQRRGKGFAFQADCWHWSFHLQVNITKVFRQSEERLIKLLQDIRKGEIDPEDAKFLEDSCSSNDEPDSSVVRLFPRNEDVDKVNEEMMSTLDEERYTFVAGDSGWRQPQFGLAPEEITLCKGARVMLIKNVDTWRRLVNGATGTVIRFEEDKEGSDLEGSDLSPNKRVKVLLPVVKFDTKKTEILVRPETWCVMEADKVVAKRKQIPLILAWAISVHKSQGMTLDKVYMNLSKTFTYGMGYVALSRVRRLEGLHLSGGLDPAMIKAHPDVLSFYKCIADRNTAPNDDTGDSQKKIEAVNRTSKPSQRFQ